MMNDNEKKMQGFLADDIEKAFWEFDHLSKKPDCNSVREAFTDQVYKVIIRMEERQNVKPKWESINKYPPIGARAKFCDNDMPCVVESKVVDGVVAVSSGVELILVNVSEIEPPELTESEEVFVNDVLNGLRQLNEKAAYVLHQKIKDLILVDQSQITKNQDK